MFNQSPDYPDPKVEDIPSYDPTHGDRNLVGSKLLGTDLVYQGIDGQGLHLSKREWVGFVEGSRHWASVEYAAWPSLLLATCVQ